MYRHRMFAQVLYGRINDYLKLNDELNALCRSRGWPEATAWVGVVGTGNEVVLEEEYPDLALFGKVAEDFPSDAEVMRLVRERAGMVVQGSIRSELLEELARPLA